MTTPTRLEFATLHAEAVLAWAKDPNVKLEVWDRTEHKWRVSECFGSPPFNENPAGDSWTPPRRLAPAPPAPVVVPLDASDTIRAQTERLMREVDQLKQERGPINDYCEHLKANVRKLEAEVDRLTKELKLREYGEAFAQEEFRAAEADRDKWKAEAMRYMQTSECCPNPLVNRTCERGTPSCIVHHDEPMEEPEPAIDPGPGYRLMENGELLTEDSEWYDGSLGWKETSHPGLRIGEPKTSCTYRCPAEPINPTEPSPGEGWRWLVPNVDVLQDGDECNDFGWRPVSSPYFGDVVFCAETFRRRIEPEVGK